MTDDAETACASSSSSSRVSDMRNPRTVRVEENKVVAPAAAAAADGVDGGAGGLCESSDRSEEDTRGMTGTEEETAAAADEAGWRASESLERLEVTVDAEAADGVGGGGGGGTSSCAVDRSGAARWCRRSTGVTTTPPTP